jgi:hypothetical protein
LGRLKIQAGNREAEREGAEAMQPVQSALGILLGSKPPLTRDANKKPGTLSVPGAVRQFQFHG